MPHASAKWSFDPESSSQSPHPQRVTICSPREFGGVERFVGPDDDLSTSGLSSLDIVNLMLSVETEFDIKIPDREMTPANFGSIARIDALVRTLVERPA
jgi:acyl carrier protein